MIPLCHPLHSEIRGKKKINKNKESTWSIFLYIKKKTPTLVVLTRSWGKTWQKEATANAALFGTLYTLSSQHASQETLIKKGILLFSWTEDKTGRVSCGHRLGPREGKREGGRGMIPPGKVPRYICATSQLGTAVPGTRLAHTLHL